jgi:hypothetical protein
MNVGELLLAHFIPFILRLVNFHGGIKKTMAHEIIKGIKAASIFLKKWEA